MFKFELGVLLMLGDNRVAVGGELVNFGDPRFGIFLVV